MIKSRVALVAVALFLLLATGSAAFSPVHTTLLVRLSPALAGAARPENLLPAKAAIVGEIPQLDLLCVSVPGPDLGEVRSAMERDPAVLYAEPNARVQATLSPDDPGWAQQWGPQKVRAPLAWEATVGDPGVIIAILDSGVSLEHPDLANQLWRNPGEVPANGVDDDGNGKVDDLWGWRFYHRWDGQTYVPAEDNVVSDDHGHGTHVAGIAGAEIDNDVGIAGMAGGSRLMAVKVLDQYGAGWYFDIAQGIVYAVDNGARIINLSLGGRPPSEALQGAVDYAYANGALVVAASGNDGGPVLYPAACEHALAVAATDPDDVRPTFSNSGPQVDVAAPGTDIYSTWPLRGGYLARSGTSMAAPHVAGLAALVWSLHPDLSVIQVSETITSTALDVNGGTFPGWDAYLGWGRIEAGRALAVTEPYHLYIPSVVYPR